MARDVASESKALLDRAKASSALITLLGSSSSIFERSMLDIYSDLQESARPKTPWLVWVTRGLSGASNGMRPLNISAWAYVDATIGERRAWDISNVLDDLFGAKSVHAISGGDLSITYVGTPLPDETLNLIGLETRIQYNRRS